VDEILAQEQESPGNPQGAATDWMTSDYQGSVVDMLSQNCLDSGVDSQNHLVYSVWGQIAGNGPGEAPPVTPTFGHDGCLTDSVTGMEYHSNGKTGRWYLPWAQRWATEDPTGLLFDSNPYRYCGNNPVNGTDPTGHELFADGQAAASQSTQWLSGELGINAHATELAGSGTFAITVAPGDLPTIEMHLQGDLNPVDQLFYSSLLSSSSDAVVSGSGGQFTVAGTSLAEVVNSIGTANVEAVLRGMLGAALQSGYTAAQVNGFLASYLGQLRGLAGGGSRAAAALGIGGFIVAAGGGPEDPAADLVAGVAVPLVLVGIIGAKQAGAFNVQALKDSLTDWIASASARQTISNATARKPSAQIRAEWEAANGTPWPKDPNTGANQDVSHKQALADNGTNDLDNIEPKPHADHVQQHVDAGDFKRWGARSGGAP
jgi:RHS repeat-associated protein